MYQSGGHRAISADPPALVRGFTLVELLVTLVVLAVLATLGAASWRGPLQRLHRADAIATLLRIQVAQEKFFLANNRYVATLAGVAAPPPAGLGVAIDSASGATPDGYYRIALGNTTATTYTATATAANGQSLDHSDCATLSIDHLGMRSPPESSGCWR